jgi:hypothetical protein
MQADSTPDVGELVRFRAASFLVYSIVVAVRRNWLRVAKGQLRCLGRSQDIHTFGRSTRAFAKFSASWENVRAFRTRRSNEHAA